MEQQQLDRFTSIANLLVLALLQEPGRFSRNSSKEVSDFFVRFKPTNTLVPAKQPLQQPAAKAAPASPQPKNLPPQPVKIDKPKPRVMPRQSVPAQTSTPIVPAPIEAHPAIFLEIERSTLLKFLPRKTVFDQPPPMDLKKAGIRFTERRSALPVQKTTDTKWVFAITPSLQESPDLKVFIDNIMKAVYQQLQRPCTLCSFLNPIGIGELAAYAVEQMPLFLFAGPHEVDLVYKVLKKLPGFKEHETKEEQFAPFGQLWDCPLVLISVAPQAPSDMLFKRSLWNALKARAE